jgi:hypothetical protein
MKNFLLAASVFSLLLPSTFTAQTRPDFSGTWRMDASRSESAMQAEPIKSMTVVIRQTPTDITFETTTDHGTTTETYSLNPKIGGLPQKTEIAEKAPSGSNKTGSAATTGSATDKSGSGSEKTARWQGDVLVTDVIRDVRGQSVTAQQSRRLAASGNEMIVESIVEVQHGYTLSGAKNYGAGKDVFVRVRP